MGFTYSESRNIVSSQSQSSGHGKLLQDGKGCTDLEKVNVKSINVTFLHIFIPEP